MTEQEKRPIYCLLPNYMNMGTFDSFMEKIGVDLIVSNGFIILEAIWIYFNRSDVIKVPGSPQKKQDKKSYDQKSPSVQQKIRWEKQGGKFSLLFFAIKI